MNTIEVKLKKEGKEKTQFFVYNPKYTIDFHYSWCHNNDICREMITKSPIYTEHEKNCDELTFYIYRQLMLEAGFMARYFWAIKKPFYEALKNDSVEFRKYKFEWKK